MLPSSSATTDIAFCAFAPFQEMRFDVRLLQRVPAEGVSRMRQCHTRHIEHSDEPSPVVGLV
jgi:hypothetical protein